MTTSLPPLATLNGKFSAYCEVCWTPAFRLWVADEAPDYTRCAIGDYTAQTCPNATAEAERAAFFRDPASRALFALSSDPQPLGSAREATEGNPVEDEPRSGGRHGRDENLLEIDR